MDSQTSSGVAIPASSTNTSAARREEADDVALPTSPRTATRTIPCPALYAVLIAAAQHPADEDDAAHVDAITSALQTAFPYTTQTLRCDGASEDEMRTSSTGKGSDDNHRTGTSGPQHKDPTAPSPTMTTPTTTTTTTTTATPPSTTTKTFVTIKQPPAACRPRGGSDGATSAGSAPAPVLMAPVEAQLPPAGVPTEATAAARGSALTERAVADLVAILETLEQFLRVSVDDTIHQDPQHMRNPAADNGHGEDAENTDLHDGDLSREDSTDMDTFDGERVLIETANSAATHGLHSLRSMSYLNNTNSSSARVHAAASRAGDESTSNHPRLSPNPPGPVGRGRGSAGSALVPSVVTAIPPPPTHARSTRHEDTPDSDHLNASKSSVPAAYTALRLSGAPAPAATGLGGSGSSEGGGGGRPGAPAGRLAFHWSRVLAIAGLFSEYIFQTVFSTAASAVGTEADGHEEEEAVRESLVARQRRVHVDVTGPLAALQDAFFRFIRTRILEGILAANKAHARVRSARLTTNAGLSSATMRSGSPSLTSRAAILSLSTSHRGLGLASARLLSPQYVSPRSELTTATAAGFPAATTTTTMTTTTTTNTTTMYVPAAACDTASAVDGAGTRLGQPDPIGQTPMSLLSSPTPSPATAAAAAAEEAAAESEETIRRSLLSWWVWLCGASGLAEATLLLLHRPPTAPSSSSSSSSSPSCSTQCFDFLLAGADYLARQYVLDHSSRFSASGNAAKLGLFASISGLPSDLLGKLPLPTGLSTASSGSLSRLGTTEAKDSAAPRAMPATAAPTVDTHDVTSPSSSSPVSYDPTMVRSHRQRTDPAPAETPTAAPAEVTVTAEEQAVQSRIEHLLAPHPAHTSGEMGNPALESEDDVAVSIRLSAALQGPHHPHPHHHHHHPRSSTTSALGGRAMQGDPATGHGGHPDLLHTHTHRTGMALTGVPEAVSTHTNHLMSVFLHQMRDPRAREPLLICSDEENDTQTINAPSSPAASDKATAKTTSSVSPAPSHFAPTTEMNTYPQFQRIQQEMATARHALQLATRLGSVYGTQDMNALLPLLPSMLPEIDKEAAAAAWVTSAEPSQHGSPHTADVMHAPADEGVPLVSAASTLGSEPLSPTRMRSSHATTWSASVRVTTPSQAGFRAQPGAVTHTPSLAGASTATPAPAAEPSPIASALAVYWANLTTNRPRYMARALQKVEHSRRVHAESDASALRHDRLLAAMHLHQERAFSTIHSPSSFCMDAEESNELALSLTLTLLHALLKAWKALNDGRDASATHASPLQSTATTHTRVCALFGYSSATWPAVADLFADDVQMAVLTALGRGQSFLSMAALEVGSIFESESHARRHDAHVQAHEKAAAPGPDHVVATTGSAAPGAAKASLTRAPARRQTFPQLWLMNFAHVADTTRHLLSAGHGSPKPLEVSMWFLAGLAEYYVRLRLHVLHTSHAFPPAGSRPAGLRSAARTIAMLQAALAPNATHANALSLYDREALLKQLREAQALQITLQADAKAESVTTAAASTTTTTAATAATAVNDGAESTASQSTWAAFWRTHYNPTNPTQRTSTEASKSFIHEELVAPAEQFFGVLTSFLETIASSYLSLADEVRHMEGRQGRNGRFVSVELSSDTDDDEEEAGQGSTSNSDSAAVRWADNNSDLDGDPRAREELSSSLRAARYANGDVEEYGSNTDVASLLAVRHARRHRGHTVLRERHESVTAAALREQQRWMETCVHYFLEIFDVLLDVSSVLEKRPLFLYALTVGLYKPHSAPARAGPAQSRTARRPTHSQSEGTPDHLLRQGLITTQMYARGRWSSPTGTAAKFMPGGEPADNDEDGESDDESETDEDGGPAARSPLQQFLTVYSATTVQRGVNRLHSRKASMLPPWLSHLLVNTAIAPSTATALASLTTTRTTTSTATHAAAPEEIQVVSDGSPSSSAGWEVSTMYWPDEKLKPWCQYLRVLQHNEAIAYFLVDNDVHALTVAPSRAACEKLRQLRAVTAQDQRAYAGSEVFISGLNALMDTSQGPCAQLLSTSCTRPRPVYLSASGAVLIEPVQTARGMARSSGSYSRLQSLVPSEVNSTGNMIHNNATNSAATSAGGAASPMGLLSNCSDLWMRLQTLRLLRSAATPLDLTQRRHFCYSLLLFSPQVEKRSMRRHFRQMALELLQRRTVLKTAQSPLYARLLLLRTVQALVSSRRLRTRRGSEVSTNAALAATSRTSAHTVGLSAQEDSPVLLGVDDPLTQPVSATHTTTTHTTTTHTTTTHTPAGGARGTPTGQSLHKLNSIHSQQSSGSSGAGAALAVVPYATTLAMWNAYTFELLRAFRELCWYHADANLEANKLGAASVLAQFLAASVPADGEEDGGVECPHETGGGGGGGGIGEMENRESSWTATDTPKTRSTAVDHEHDTLGTLPPLPGASDAAVFTANPAFVISADVVPADFVDFEDYGNDECDQAQPEDGEGDDDVATADTMTPPPPPPPPPAVAMEEEEVPSATTQATPGTQETAPVPSGQLPTAAPPLPGTGFALPKLSLMGLGPALYYASSGDTGAAQEAALLFNTTVAASHQTHEHTAAPSALLSGTPSQTENTGETASTGTAGAGGAPALHGHSGSGALHALPRRTTSGLHSSFSHVDGSSPFGASLSLTGSPPGSVLTTDRQGSTHAENEDGTAPTTTTNTATVATTTAATRVPALATPSSPSTSAMDLHASAGGSQPPAAPAPAPFKLPTLSFGSLGPPLYFLSSGDTGMAQSQATEGTGLAAYGAASAAASASTLTTIGHNSSSAELPAPPAAVSSSDLPPVAPSATTGLPPMAPMPSTAPTLITTTTTMTTTNTATNQHSVPQPRSSSSSGGGRPPLPVPSALPPLAQPPTAPTAHVDDVEDDDEAEAKRPPLPTLGITPTAPSLATRPTQPDEADGSPARHAPFGRRRSLLGLHSADMGTKPTGRAKAERGTGRPHHPSQTAAGGRSASAAGQAHAPVAAASVPVQTVQRVVPTLRRQDSLRRQASVSTELTHGPVDTGSDTVPSAAATLSTMALPTLSLGSANDSFLINESAHPANASLPLSASPADASAVLMMGSPPFAALAAAAATSATASPKKRARGTPGEPLALYALTPAVTAELILNICAFIVQRRGGMIGYGFTVSALVQRKLPATYAIQPRLLTSLISHFTGGTDNHRTPASGDRLSRRLGAAQLTPAPQGPSSYHVLRSLRQYLHTQNKMQRTVADLLHDWLFAQFGTTLAQLWSDPSQAPVMGPEAPAERWGMDDYGCQPLAVGLGTLVSLLLPDRSALTCLEVNRRLGTGGYGSVMAAQYQPTRRSTTMASPHSGCTTRPTTARASQPAHSFQELIERSFVRTPNIALKMLPLSLQGSEGGMLPTVHAEVLHMLRLHGHPHVVEIVSFGCTGDEYYLAMPHYEAGSVQRWRVTHYPPGCAPLMNTSTSPEEKGGERGTRAVPGQTNKSLPNRPSTRTMTSTTRSAGLADKEARTEATESQLFVLCADIFTQVLEAVVFMHQRNIRHGDLKADNVFVSQSLAPEAEDPPTGTTSSSHRLHVRVGDFGSSDTCDEDDLRALVRDVESGESRFLAGRWGSGRGTEAIQPPEMLFPKRRYQVLSGLLDDIYARYEAEEAAQQHEHDEATPAPADATTSASSIHSASSVTMAAGTTPFAAAAAGTSTTGGTSSYPNARHRSHASISEAVFAVAREQVRRAELSVDIWACGCLLYELLTGRMLFGGARVGRAFVLATTAMREQLVFDAGRGGARTCETPLLSAHPTTTQRSARDEAGDGAGAVKTLDEWERRDLRLAVGEPVERFMSTLLNLNPLERPTATEALYRWKELLAQRRHPLAL